ncbi:MAG: hydrophobe/amphiphile efflux-1 family RND transporter [Oceanospirillaceae bacterium]|uniref:Efflux pump membrane transporter n=2 Tax=Alphaproteobacteria TaxID=28211 RepID=A0A3B9GYD1_9PROT|nr:MULTISPECIES: efflux RND transporter permease subunit [Alphaproteobacteria]MAB09269.1 hydrophobe/amphiphile efflux-1 family RND transporter [Hyphomonas sp.]MAX99635.1 hydrophobe/amphiphile efflux-1 family RND transporter [Oceanospirillaceae bacterium]MBB97920.1 hydrophobe/amphiphile efflux-1 family RND transporter [Paracoccaceae bacterium]OAZ13655.1 transporter [Thalassospira profundimaris]AXO16403.1 hydrophobe/amphiphile efflux-1 family RND transporter [Thalassospira indica]|tara:strand:+ start:1206 stop:4376 length:3171 start_codon:yes stop_codon:yes gene_type:complete
MNIPRFFVDRPIFAVVLSVLMLIAGGLTLLKLPLSEYPQVTPPTVQVTASYPGANPEVIAETVAAPLEQAINGVENMLYMSSQAATDGRMTLTIAFKQGTDPDMAQIQVQNRVSRALPRLPLEVQRIGVVTQKTSPDILMVVHLVSPDDRYDPLYLSNFAILQVRDQLARLPGVGDVILGGAGEYSMRIWLDPAKVAARGLTASDIVAAIQEQNVQVAAGSVGQQPEASAAFQVTVNTLGRLSSEEQFGEIVIKAGTDGQVTRLRDVARIELGADSYALRSLLDGKPALAMQIIQSPGANALDVSSAVRTTMAEFQKGFPEGIEYRIAYDPTVFVKASLEAVVMTLLEAVVLVVIVVVLFLQTWRASIIPLVAVPVSLVGTFALMYMFGFSLNTLSLFGLVLSIGIVVDDAIVVVENVERHIALGETPKEAARKAMDEVTGPIVAITSVLSAVFIPSAFLSGLQGEFYRQFALTIAISTILSAINSLTLSPALAGVLLKPHHGDVKRDLPTRVIDFLFGWFFRLFNRFFDGASNAYVWSVRRAARLSVLVLLVYAGLVGMTWVGFQTVPNGFVPAQDKYYLVGIAQLPTGASLDRTEAVVKKMSEIALAEPGVESVVAFPGLSVNGMVNIPNAAVMFTMLKPFDERKDPSLSAFAIAGKLMGKFSQIPDGFAGMFPPPPVPGLGSTGGFKIQIEDRAGLGFEALAQAQGAIMGRAMQTPELAGMLASFQVNAPQVQVDIDRVKAKSQGVPLNTIFETLQVNLGSLYANDFNRFGRTYRVMVQADAPFRMQPEDIGRLKVRNSAGDMIPLSALLTIKHSSGPDRVMHYNGFPSADISGSPAPGYSFGQATAAMERIASETLPPGMAFEWTDLAYQEKQAGNTAMFVFPLSVLLAFLILAAQYNSWSLPFAVLLIAPMALLSAIAGVWFTGGDNNIFTQIGFVVLVGLAAKNAILIVEFARAKEDEGVDPLAAVLEAARLRLRPILMTSLAFIAGVVPLVIATGAGAEMRHAMGIAVFAGMLGVTLFGLLLTPIFYVVVRRLAIRRDPSPQQATKAHA